MDLSVIIVTLNEEKYILKTISTAREQLSGNCEVEFILVDAGSSDRTVDVSRSYFDKVFEDPKMAGYKYLSLNEGARLASGKVLHFLDADCIVPKDYDQLIMNAFADERVVGGAFEFKIDRSDLSYLIIQRINRIRYRLTQNYFGDQGIFCTRNVFDQLGGFPKEPIMEAAYFCSKLRHEGRLRLVKQPLLTSARRLDKGGVWTVFFFDTRVWLRFLLGLSTAEFANSYWEKNKNGSF